MSCGVVHGTLLRSLHISLCAPSLALPSLSPNIILFKIGTDFVGTELERVPSPPGKRANIHFRTAQSKHFPEPLARERPGTRRAKYPFQPVPAYVRTALQLLARTRGQPQKGSKKDSLDQQTATTATVTTRTQCRTLSALGSVGSARGQSKGSVSEPRPGRAEPLQTAAPCRAVPCRAVPYRYRYRALPCPAVPCPALPCPALP